ncbi:hypothetical protein Tco_0554809 [Tanacetum coccineum]|uniref:Uncharacterized protein n=1 Tax=Tanacetum coccineum TaxID=301880 RepID=A0ABQ5BWW5_9ASTR
MSARPGQKKEARWVVGKRFLESINDAKSHYRLAPSEWRSCRVNSMNSGQGFLFDQSHRLGKVPVLFVKEKGGDRDLDMCIDYREILGRIPPELVHEETGFD